ncbi:hypothetical protein PAPHI01_1936 [Pancytospora philotis]|nr:hypothetical protein PAPHI01_1936 [Pancytospora philotis]
MLAVVSCVLEGVAASQFEGSDFAPLDMSRGYDRIIREISPFKEILVTNHGRDRDLFEKIYDRAVKHSGKPPNDATVTEAMIYAVADYIVRDPSPIECVEKKLLFCNCLAEYTMIASIIRFAQGKPSNAEQRSRIKLLLEHLDEQIAAKRAVDPKDFFVRKRKGRFLYDALVYLFSEVDSGVDAVRERFRKMLQAAAEKRDVHHNILGTIVKLVNALDSATFICDIEQYEFQEAFLAFVTSQDGLWAVKFLDSIKLSGGTAELVLEYVTSGQHLRVNPCFVVLYAQYALENVTQNALWVESILFKYFTEAGLPVRLRWLCEMPEILRRMPVRVICHVLHYIWKDPALSLASFIDEKMKDVEVSLFLGTLASTLTVDHYPGFYPVLLEHCPSNIKNAWVAYIAELHAQSSAR